MGMNVAVTDMITIPKATWWNFWFHPNGGMYQHLHTIDRDTHHLYPVARPYWDNSWNLEGDDVTVILESLPLQGGGIAYRHNYVLLVKNFDTVNSNAFFVAVSEVW